MKELKQNRNFIHVLTKLIIGIPYDKTIFENTYRYNQTRFFGLLLMLAVSSINLTADKFQFFPLQDFTSGTDIDWNQRVDEYASRISKTARSVSPPCH